MRVRRRHVAFSLSIATLVHLTALAFVVVLPGTPAMIAGAGERSLSLRFVGGQLGTGGTRANTLADIGAPTPAAVDLEAALRPVTPADERMLEPVPAGSAIPPRIPAKRLTATSAIDALAPQPVTFEPLARIEPRIVNPAGAPRVEAVRDSQAALMIRRRDLDHERDTPPTVIKPVMLASTGSSWKLAEAIARQHPGLRKAAVSRQGASATFSARPGTGHPIGPARLGDTQVAAWKPGGTALQRARFKSKPRPPTYPARAQELRQEGTVWLRALVGVHGRAKTIVIATSSGYPLLDAAATRAVRKWAFEPARRNGHTTQSWVRIPVRFALR